MKASAGAAGLTMLAGGSGPFAGVAAKGGGRSRVDTYAQVDDVVAATEEAQRLGATILRAKPRGPAGEFSVVRDPVSRRYPHGNLPVEGTIMNGRYRCIGEEFLALVDYKESGLVVKLSKRRVDELIASGVGPPFSPAGRRFKEWVPVPKPNHRRGRALLHEGVASRKRPTDVA